MPTAAIHRELGVSRAAIRDWITHPDAALAERARATCFACAGTTCPSPGRYAYLLGQYLGDGYLVTTIRVPRLRIACADSYPGIAAEVDDAMHTLSENRVTAEWQAAIVGEHPWPLIRGLIHSDGCRAINRVITRGKSYSYPRYFFANESRDILAIMGDALDRVGVQWRFNRPNSISIAQAASVELVDRHVGPKA